MTENKRFTNTDNGFIVDYESKQKVLNLYDVIELLNELHEENEQLKQAYTQLEHRHSLLHDECIDAECDRDSYRKDIVSLEKENEQLKKEVEDLKQALIRCAFDDK